MLSLQEFRPSYAKNLVPQMAQADARVTDAELTELARWPSYALLDGDEPICCMGIYPSEARRWRAWAYISKDLGSRFRYVHRAIKAFLNDVGIKCIEATVAADHAEGHRWMRHLGFKIDSVEGVWVNYVRVK